MSTVLSPIFNPISSYPKGTEPQHIVIDKPSSATLIYSNREKLYGSANYQNPFSFKSVDSKIISEVRAIAPGGFRGYLQVNNINKYNNVITVILDNTHEITLTMLPNSYSPDLFLRYVSEQLTALCATSGEPYEFEYAYSALDDAGSLSCKDVPFTAYKNYSFKAGTSFMDNYSRMMRIDFPTVLHYEKLFWSMNMLWTRNLNIICAQLTKNCRISAMGTSQQNVFLSIPWPEPWVKDKIITPASDLTNNHFMTFTNTVISSTIAFLIVDDDGIDISQYSPGSDQYFSDIYVSITI